jgi:hypothetical protein
MLKRQCHEMDIFCDGLNILINTFCVCANGLLKDFHYFTQFLTFICFFENTYKS